MRIYRVNKNALAIHVILQVLLCMSPDVFDHMAQLLQPVIQKQNTNFRQPIFVKERLVVTLRCLASGDLQQSLGWTHRIGKATISKIT